jgi:hypothetical protein
LLLNVLLLNILSLNILLLDILSLNILPFDIFSINIVDLDRKLIPAYLEQGKLYELGEGESNVDADEEGGVEGGHRGREDDDGLTLPVLERGLPHRQATWRQCYNHSAILPILGEKIVRFFLKTIFKTNFCRTLAVFLSNTPFFQFFTYIKNQSLSTYVEVHRSCLFTSCRMTKWFNVDVSPADPSLLEIRGSVAG